MRTPFWPISPMLPITRTSNNADRRRRMGNYASMQTQAERRKPGYPTCIWGSSGQRSPVSLPAAREIVRLPSWGLSNGQDTERGSGAFVTGIYGGVRQKWVLARFDNTSVTIRSLGEINYCSWNGTYTWPRSVDTMRATVPETVALVPKAVRLPATAPVTRLLLRGRGNLVKKTTLETSFAARLRSRHLESPGGCWPRLLGSDDSIWLPGGGGGEGGV
jgi:hypothetical protein